MMTLIDMAQLVCDKVGKNDDESLAVCKKFINRAYSTVHDRALWRQSIDVWDVSALNGKVVLPHECGQLLAVTDRVRGVAIHPQDLVAMFIERPGTFNSSGLPVRYSFMAPVPVTQAFYDYFDGIGEGQHIIKVLPDGAVSGTVWVYGDTGDGELQKVSISLNGPGAQQTTVSFDGDLISLSKTVTDQALSFKDRNDNVILRLMPNERERKHVRIRLHNTPSGTTPLRILAKRRAPVLTDDGDTLPMPEAAEAVMDMAQADMLERARQYDKARLKKQEATGRVAVLLDLEKTQTSNTSYIVPDMGELSYEALSAGTEAVDSTPVQSMKSNTITGSYNIPTNSSGGAVTVSFGAVPLSVVPSLRIPNGGLGMNVNIVGNPTSTGFTFQLTGITDSAGYYLDYVATLP